MLWWWWWLLRSAVDVLGALGGKWWWFLLRIAIFGRHFVGRGEGGKVSLCSLVLYVALSARGCCELLGFGGRGSKFGENPLVLLRDAFGNRVPRLT